MFMLGFLLAAILLLGFSFFLMFGMLLLMAHLTQDMSPVPRLLLTLSMSFVVIPAVLIVIDRWTIMRRGEHSSFFTAYKLILGMQAAIPPMFLLFAYLGDNLDMKGFGPDTGPALRAKYGDAIPYWLSEAPAEWTALQFFGGLSLIMGIPFLVMHWVAWRHEKRFVVAEVTYDNQRQIDIQTEAILRADRIRQGGLRDESNLSAADREELIDIQAEAILRAEALKKERGL